MNSFESGRKYLFGESQVGIGEIKIMKKSYVYLLTNKNNTVIYVGVTGNLVKRIYEHKTDTFHGFTSRYNCNKLIYFEEFSYILEAIEREKQIKTGNRRRKEQFVNSVNPNWNDLAKGWLFYFA